MKFANKQAIVTGASQGIGKAIALALAEQGAALFMVGRSIDRLKSAARDFEAVVPPKYLQADLLNPQDISAIVKAYAASNDALDVLVNCGGAYARAGWSQAPLDDLHRLLETNVRGPFLLTQLLLPYLSKSSGDVVFINSSVVRGSGAGTSQYAASKHALKSLADSLRAEVNDKGIRVTSIYPGRTATPRQKAIYETEGRAYRPEKLLQPKDVANAVVACLGLAESAEVTDLYIRQRYKT